MKGLSWRILLGFSLISLSVVLYLIHYAIFRDARHIILYLIGDLAFVPIQVLFVTLIIDQWLSRREKQAMMNKLNMVIGAFFSEVGTGLLKFFAQFDPHSDQIGKELIFTSAWPGKIFLSVRQSLKNYDFPVEVQRGDLEDLRRFLVGKRDFLLALLENPNLLEHESFTELLWAVFHLSEELAIRVDVKNLPEKDCAHLAGDMKRAYSALISEWLAYMKHLQEAYPYLFSLAMRTNPFDPQASPVVQ